MSDLKNAIVTITSVQKKQAKSGNLFYKITDNNGVTYNLFTVKQDGTETKASQKLKNLPNEGIGEFVELAYSESVYNYQGKNVTSKNIQKLIPATGGERVIDVDADVKNVTYTPPPQRDFQAEAWGKCRHAYLLDAYSQGKTLEEAKEKSALWADASMQSREDWIAEKNRKSQSQKERSEIEAESQHDYDEIEVDDEINVEGIPF